MELTISKQNLTSSLQKISGVATDNIVISADEKVSISATNGIISIMQSCPAEIKKPGEVCIDYKRIANFAKNYTGESVTLKSTKAGWLNIEGTRVKLRVPGAHKDNWPIIKFKRPANEITADKTEIKNGIALTEFAVGQNIAREGMLGLNLKSESGNILFTSADGHMATRYSAKSDSEFNILIPHKSAVEIMKSIDDDCQIFYDENIIQFESDSIKFKTTLLGAQFPAIDKLFADRKNSIKVNRESLISFINILDSIVSIEKDPVVKFSIKENKIDILSKKMDTGDGDASIDCDYSGDEISVGVNIILLRNAIKGFGIMKEENIILNIDGQDAPILVTSESIENYRTFFMPVRIKW